jgi:hypothetical protein
MYEMKQVLATVLSHCGMRLVGDREERAVMQGATLGPERGVKMQIVELRGKLSS